MTETYNVVILGGGHNGLTTAAYLAGAGCKVVVLEKNATVGGAATTEEFAPGFRNSVASYTVSLLNPKVIHDLDLIGRGLKIVERPAGNFWPINDQCAIHLPYGSRASRQKILAKFSPKDAERYADYDDALERAANVLRDLVTRTPPNAGGGILELIKGGAVGRRMLKLSLEDQRLLVSLFTGSAESFLDRWFENAHIKAVFAFDGIVGSYMPPSSPGSAYVLLHHCFGEVNGKTGVWGHAIGGMGAISNAIAATARARGAIIRTDAKVSSLRMDGARASGVVLSTGEEIRARVVASNIPPKLLFRDIVPTDAVAPEIRAAFTGMTTGSGVFRMNVALSELPDFTSMPGKDAGPHHGAGIIIAPTMDYMEHAYWDARRYGTLREPIVEMLIPSLLDDSLAPSGKHVASLFVQYVAPRLPEPRSWANEIEKATFADTVIDTVTKYAPNFRQAVLARQILSPFDLEQRFGLIDGDIFHGQLGLGQLFSARPVLGYANYRMPVPGLYLCGSGAHPGGGVTGVPGMNAAREIAKDLRLRRI